MPKKDLTVNYETIGFQPKNQMNSTDAKDNPGKRRNSQRGQNISTLLQLANLLPK
jgi:hypothetical protein